MMAAVVLTALGARANFEVQITPNPIQVPAGARANFTLVTQNQGLPEDAFSIEYSIIGIRSEAGQTVDIIMAKVVTKAPAFGPLSFSLPIPAQTASGEYSLSLRGDVMKNEGGSYGAKEFPDVAKIVVQGTTPAASGPITPCAATLDPEEITLPNDRSGVEVRVRTSPDCVAPKIRYGFSTLPGANFTADLCTVPVEKQPDGSYPEAKFLVRAAPNAAVREWMVPIRGFSGTSFEDVVRPALALKVNVVSGAAPVPSQTAARVEVKPQSLDLAPGETASVQVGVYAATPGVIQSGVMVNTTYNGSPAQAEGEQFQMAIDSQHRVTITANSSVVEGTQGEIIFTVISPQVSGEASASVRVRIKGPAAPVQLPVNFPAGSRVLKNGESGNCLTAEDGRATGSRLVMAPCGSKASLQSFSFGPHGEIHSGDKCAVLSNSSTDDNTPIVLWNCNNAGQSNEMWTLDGSSRLIGRDFGKCLEPNGSDELNHAAILRPCWDGANQKWSLDQPPPPPPTKLARNFPAASGMLKNREYGNCLTIENDQHGDGVHLVMAPCASQAEAQMFTFGPNGEIQNGNKCASLYYGKTDDDTPVVLWTCNNGGQSNEMWTFDSSSRLIGREFGKCLEPNENDPNHAAYLRPCWDGGNQKWSVEQPPAAPQKLAVSFPAKKGTLKNRDTGKCLAPENIRQGSRLVLQDCNNLSYQTFDFGSNGEIQVGGYCAVLQSNATEDNTPIVLWECSKLGQSNEIWTLDSSSRLIGRENQKCIEPNGSDPAHNAIFRPCYDGENQKWSVEQPAAGGEFTIAVKEAQFSVSVGAAFSAFHWSVTPSNRLDMPNERLNFTIEFDNSILKQAFADEYKGKILPNADIISSSFRGLQPGETTIRLTVTGPSTGISHTVEIPVTVGGGGQVAQVNRGGGRRKGGKLGEDRPVPGRDDDPGPVPEPPAADLSNFPKDLQDQIRSVRADNISLEGLGDALEAFGSEPIIDAQSAGEQIAFLQGYEALMRQVETPSFWSSISSSDDAAKIPRSDSPDADPAILASMFDHESLMYRAPNHARYQTAALGNLPFLFEIGSPELLRQINKDERQSWTPYSRAEMVIQELRWASRFKSVTDATDSIGRGLTILDLVIANSGLDQMDAKAGGIFLKSVAIANTIVTIADVMAKAGVAYFPNHVERLYTVINDHTSGNNDKIDAVTIGAGDRANLKVFIQTGSPGGPIISPAKAASLIAAAVFKTPKFKAWQAKHRQDASIDTLMAEKFAQVVLKKVNVQFLAAWATITKAPQLEPWLKWGATPWTKKAFSNPPLEINSNRVIYMESNSPREIWVGPDDGSSGRERAYVIKGLAPTPPQGPGAGFRLGLRPALAQEIGRFAPGSILNKQGIVNVTGNRKGPEPAIACTTSDGLAGTIQQDGSCRGAN